MTDQQFPETFWWGTAASSPESEGAAEASDWYAWEQAGMAPPSGNGNGFADRYAEDFRLYAAHGLTHHRLGIEWARVEPAPGRRDEAAVEHYRNVLRAAHDTGVSPWVCLHHFVLPTWVAPKGMGFCDPRARDYFWPRHLEFVAETFGDLVAGWQPVNEPVVYAANGFLAGVNPPGLTDFDAAMRALEGAHLAEAGAWRILRQTGKPVSTVHALVPMFPANDSSGAAAAAATLEAAAWDGWIGALHTGVLTLPGREPVAIPDYQGAFDVIGFSYYCAMAVSASLDVSPHPPRARVGPMGYAPWSRGLGLVLDRLADRVPDKPLLIAEHGVGTTDDSWRCEILADSLSVVADRLERGHDIRGFFHWTGVDNYEWAQGFEVPFGLFDGDRRPKGSADLLREVATTGRVPRGTRLGEVRG